MPRSIAASAIASALSSPSQNVVCVCRFALQYGRGEANAEARGALSSLGFFMEHFPHLLLDYVGRLRLYHVAPCAKAQRLNDGFFLRCL